MQGGQQYRHVCCLLYDLIRPRARRRRVANTASCSICVPINTDADNSALSTTASGQLMYSAGVVLSACSFIMRRLSISQQSHRFLMAQETP